MVTTWKKVTPPTGPDISDPMTMEFPCVGGVQYLLRFTVTGRTVGSVDGGADVTTDTVTATTDGEYSLQFTSLGTGTGVVTFIPSGGFDGSEVNVGVFEVNATPWTIIPTPVGTSSVTTGYAYGLLLAITRPQTVTSDNWTRIAVPATTWTSIPKSL